MFERDRIIHEDIQGDFRLEVCYNENHTYDIRVTHISTGRFEDRNVPATYEPRFGIDAQDLMDIAMVAEAVCVRMERESD